MRDNCGYYRQHMDARYMPAVLHSVNGLACSAFQHSMKLFKISNMIGRNDTNHLGICRIGIRTQDYAITSHVDKSDLIPTKTELQLMDEWQNMLSSSHLHPVGQK